MAFSNIPKQPTGINELDEILDGGFPKNANIILSGTPGTGKTILGQQWLYKGYDQFKEPGLYVGFTESTEKILANLQGLHFYAKAATAPRKVHFVDFRNILKNLAFNTGKAIPAEDLDEVVDVIRHIADNMGAKRIVIDSLTAILNLIESPTAVRDFVFKLGTSLSNINATLLLVTESASDKEDYGIEDFVADGIINLEIEAGQQRMIRHMDVLKMRATNFRSGKVIYDLTDEGIKIYQKIPSYTEVAQTDFDKRLPFGVKGFDPLIGGGIPQGHIVLLGGNTGSGKSTFGLHFAAQGIKDGENCCFVALEESVTQVKKTAAQHHLDFEKWQRQGKLHFVTGELIDINPDRLLYDIVDLVDTTKVKRIVIDSISSLENAAFDHTRIREFLLQLIAYLKQKGVTCMMTYLTTELFGAQPGQLMSGTASTELGLSSMVDGIILLRYVERDQEVKKLLNILKLRGSDHEKHILEFRVTAGGVVIGDKFQE